MCQLEKIVSIRSSELRSRLFAVLFFGCFSCVFWLVGWFLVYMVSFPSL